MKYSSLDVCKCGHTKLVHFSGCQYTKHGCRCQKFTFDKLATQSYRVAVKNDYSEERLKKEMSRILTELQTTGSFDDDPKKICK